ncbi:RNA-directed DNA polymerase, eukaryota, reverse transcriptase zinc-binding domain protein [Tanacetum coccineum]
MIKNEKGESFIDVKVLEQFVLHFKEFLGTSQPTQLDLLDKIEFDKTVSRADADWMLKPVSNKEIKLAMFDIDDNRAPGPDGFSSKFYKQAWNIVGNYVCVVVKEFFNKGKLLGELNAIVISLIPKLETPTKVVKGALDHFCNMSGLKPNLGKSTAFFGNIKDHVNQAILAILTFKVGSLPVSYLGVPLVSKQIGINDCKRLTDKIKERVLNWKNKMLTYAGRLQLIASVLFVIHMYWASVLMLPKTVIKDIDRILKGFLWNQWDLKKGSAKKPGEVNQSVSDEVIKGSIQGGSDEVYAGKEVRDEVNSLFKDNVADYDVEHELDSCDDGIGLDKEESFPSLNNSINKVNTECLENNRADESRNSGNKFNLVPTDKEDGRDVIFEEEMVEEGSKKWKLTLCGYFVGYKMSYWELRYNLFKIWGRYGLKEIILQNGMFLFKFKHEEGLESILKAGPWMTVKGISSIASSLGKPLIMDKVTTQMCTEGIGRIRFARVLVEMNAKTDLKDRIEMCYRNKNNETVGTKFVDVEYAWKPVRCSHCAVFRHAYSKSGFNPEKVKETVIPKNNKNNKEKWTDNEGFVHVRRNNAVKPNSNFGGRMQGMKKRTEFRPVRKEGQNNEAQKHDPIPANHGKQTPNVLDNTKKSGKQTPYKEKEWGVPKDVIDAIRKSANKYSVLEDQDEEEILEGINLEEKGVVDRYVQEKIQLNLLITNGWSHTMVNYIKNQWDKINGRDGTEVVEVMDNDIGIAKSVIANNLRSIDGSSCLKLLTAVFNEYRQDPSNGILKIDRILGNSVFICKFSNAHVVFLPYLTSDHCPALLQIPNAVNKPKKLLDLPILTEEWKDKLKEIQTKIDVDPHNVDLRNEEAMIHKEYCEAISDEEKFLFKHAKIDWLKDRNRNTKFFHAYLKSRRNRSRITKIKNEKGESFIDDKFLEQFVLHFKEFLGTSQPTQLNLLDKIEFDKTVSQADADWMLRPVSNEEIKLDMFDIDDNRAPGLDVFSSKFYKQA